MASPKNIIYIWKGPYPWDVRVEKICTSLSEAGHNVHILARWGGETLEEEVIDGIHIHRVGINRPSFYSLPFPFNPVWRNSLDYLARKTKADLLIPRDILLAEEAGEIGKKYNIPVVMDMAENYPAAMKLWKKYSDKWYYRFLFNTLKIPDWVEKRAVSLMYGIITVCEEQIGRLEEEYKYNPANCTVVHNTPLNAILAESVGKKEVGNIVIGHHGYLSKEKDISLLIHAAVEFKDELDKVEFKIAGTGECLNELEQIAQEGGVNNVEFTGAYGINSTYDIVNSFDIGILPYPVNEFNNFTIHNKIFDYFALGKPVIVSGANPLIRIINETRAGVVADCSTTEGINNGISEILNSDYKCLSLNAQKAYEYKYNWGVDSVNLLAFLNKYIN